MNGGIYLIQNDGALVEMTEQPYDSESLLQALLARYPALLAGDQMDTEAPRRWMLVGREHPVPGEEAGQGRWALDHLFLDQEAIPTLVEVKRSSDTRLRREVVGQMLDYAANAVVYWPIEAIRSRFEARCETDGLEPDEVFRRELGIETAIDIDGFWERVKTNLQAGRVRLVFVADEIPSELRRVVEFLNGQMEPAEVLAVEIRQYFGQGLKTLVPRVVGQSAGAEKRKSSSGSVTTWDRTTFVDATRSALPPSQATAVESVLEASAAIADEMDYGRGRTGSFSPKFFWASKKSFFTVRTNGMFVVNLKWHNQPHAGERAGAVRDEFVQRLHAAGLKVPEGMDYPAFEPAAWVNKADVVVAIIRDCSAGSRSLEL